MTQFLLDGLFFWLTSQVLTALSWLLDLVTSTFFASPDVTVLPQVTTLSTRATAVTDAVFVLAILVAGILAMTHGSFQIRYAAKDLVPRLVVAFILSRFGLVLCHGLIEVANAVTVAMVGQAATGPRVVIYVREQLLDAMIDPTVQVFAALISVIIVVLFFQLLLSWFARVAVLLVLAGVAPLALACYALPQTQPVVDLWWRALLGALVTPALQGVVFSAGVDLLLTGPGTVTHLMGVALPPGSPTSIIVNLFLVVCLLFVTVRIPKLVARHVLNRGSSTSSAGLVLRALVLQTVTRKIPVGLRKLAR
jgi:hypothetical protein